jgi:predicted nucleic acid-binding protein
VRSSSAIDPALQPLDSGEREVIALALSTGADAVLLDERKGRHAAENADCECQEHLV